MADDDPREDEQTELFAPPGPRRSTYTAPKNDEETLLNAANVFSDDDLAEALAEQFGPSKIAAASSRHRVAGVEVDAPATVATPPADESDSLPAPEQASPVAAEPTGVPEPTEHPSGAHVAPTAPTPEPTPRATVAAVSAATVAPGADTEQPAASEKVTVEHAPAAHVAVDPESSAPLHGAVPLEPTVSVPAGHPISADAPLSDPPPVIASIAGDFAAVPSAVDAAERSRLAPDEPGTSPIDFDDAAYKRPRRRSRDQADLASAAAASVVAAPVGAVVDGNVDQEPVAAGAPATAPAGAPEQVASVGADPTGADDEAPVSEASVSEAPVSEAPVFELPVLEVPVSDMAVTEVPVTDMPASETPVSAFDALLAEPTIPKAVAPAVPPPVWLFARDVVEPDIADEPAAVDRFDGEPSATGGIAEESEFAASVHADEVVPDAHPAEGEADRGAGDGYDDVDDAPVDDAPVDDAPVDDAAVDDVPSGNPAVVVNDGPADGTDETTDMDELFKTVMGMGPEVVDLPEESVTPDTAEVPVIVPADGQSDVAPDHSDTRETPVVAPSGQTFVTGGDGITSGVAPSVAPFVSEPTATGTDTAGSSSAAAPVTPWPEVDSTAPAENLALPGATASAATATSVIDEPVASARRSPFEAEELGEEPTPRELRVGRAARLFWLWFAANSSLVSVAFGAIIFSLGMSLRQSIVSILAGVALSFLPLGLGTLASKRSGQPTMVVSRATFGMVGNIIPAVIALVSRLFWGAALLWILSAGTASILVGANMAGNFSAKQVTLLTMAIGFLIALVIAFFGYHTLVRIQLVLSIVSAVLILGFIALTVGNIDVNAALSVPDGSWSLPVTGAVLVFSFVGLVWANSSGDLARYQRSSSSSGASMLWATFGTALPSFLLIAYGALLAASRPSLAAGLVSDPFDALGRMLPSWYPIPLVAATALSLLSGVAIALYSSAFALQATRIRGARPFLVVVLGVVLAVIAGALALTASGFESVFRDFATTLAVPVAAWAGIFASDTMIRNRRYDTASLVRRGGIYADVRWVNLIMLIVASIVGLGFTSATVGWLGWEGYLFGVLGVPLDSTVAATDIGVLIALLIGVITPLVSGVPAVRRQEIVGS